MKIIGWVGICILAAILGMSTGAARADMGMVTGHKTGTYYQFGQDIAEVAQRYGLPIQVKESAGSIRNIERMNSRENAAFGIVQSDVLGFLYLKKPEVAKKLSMIYPFYNEEVHILARKRIASFADLEGKKIATGTKGSGNWLTIANLFHITGIKPGKEIMDLKPLDAMIYVLEGKIDAMIYVAGKPVKLFSKLEQLHTTPRYRSLIDQVHFIPLDQPEMLADYYAPSMISPSDYPWLTKRVRTIAVTALLVSFDFSTYQTAYYQQRCRQLHQLALLIRNNLDYFKKNGHQKWNDVDLDRKIDKWKMDRCAHPARRAPQRNELYDVLKEMFE